MRNVHGMFIYIYIEHGNLETRKTRNDFFVQVRNFLLPLSLKVLRHKEGEARSFYSGFFSCPPPHTHTRVAPATNVSASKRKPMRLLPRQVSSQLVRCLVSTFPKSSARFRCVTSFALASLCFPSRAIVTSLSDTSALRARLNTCVNVAPN